MARPTFARYAERFGYELDLRTAAPPTERPLAWAKVLILLELLSRYETVVWVDADAVIVDFDRDIAGELRDGAFLALVEHQVGADRVPNTGVMAIRSSPPAQSFWNAVWSRTDLVDHPWWDNAAVCALLGYRLATWPRAPGETLRDWPWRHSLRHAAWHLRCRLHDHLGIEVLTVRPARGGPPPGIRLVGNEWNSIPADPSPAPRIKHYPGEPIDVREAKMRADADPHRAGHGTP